MVTHHRDLDGVAVGGVPVERDLDRGGVELSALIRPGELLLVELLQPFRALRSGGGGLGQQRAPGQGESCGGEDGAPALDSPEAVEALAEYGSYVDKGLSRKSNPPGYDVVKDFGNDRVPMFVSGPWIVNLLNEQQPQIKGNWAAVPLPPRTMQVRT